MEWKALEEINKSLETAPIKGKPYIEVNKRVIAFRQLEPNGTIATDIVTLENGVVTMKATVYAADGKVLATGYAQEKEQSSFINKTSYIENCETSAVGRALGFCGIGIDGSIASAEEVSNAIYQQEGKNPLEAKSGAQRGTPRAQTKQPTQGQAISNRDKVTILCQERGIDAKALAAKYGLNKQTTEQRFAEVLAELEGASK